MIYGLNDADERVRRMSADEISDALKKNPCCCSKEVVAALTCALADCDRRVRHHAEKALRQCGYEIVDGCCKPGCVASVGGCAPAGPAPSMAPAPAPSAAPAPAPAPPEDSKAYFPSRLRDQQTQDGVRQTNRLANLFGLLD